MRDAIPNRRRLAGGLAVAAFLLVLTVVGVAAVPQVIGAKGSYVVLSSSMSPTIDAGDVVVVRDADPSAIETGDVITYRSPTDADRRVTHRVVAVQSWDGGPAFRTKGDANEEADAALVPAENVVGVVWFHIPLVGYLLQFASSTVGIALLVVVPAVLLVVTELRDLYRAATTVTDEERATETPPGQREE